MACIFCSIAAGKIPCHRVWENRGYLLMLDIRPIAPGHLLLLPKKHADDLFKLPERDYARLLTTARKAATVLRRATGAKRIGLVVEGFGVPHVHVHLVPIEKPGELNPARAKAASPAKLQALERKLTTRFRILR
jgi:histidine triad (HIT) family protein